MISPSQSRGAMAIAARAIARTPARVNGPGPPAGPGLAHSRRMRLATPVRSAAHQRACGARHAAPAAPCPVPQRPHRGRSVRRPGRAWRRWTRPRRPGVPRRRRGPLYSIGAPRRAGGPVRVSVSCIGRPRVCGGSGAGGAATSRDQPDRPFCRPSGKPSRRAARHIIYARASYISVYCCVDVNSLR